MIYKTLENLKLNMQPELKAGSFFNAEPSTLLDKLVEDGALARIEGAKSIEEAKVACEALDTKETKEEEVKDAQDTWGPTKSDEDTWGPDIKAKEPEKTDKDELEEYDGPMGKYEVIGEIYPLNEDGSNKDTPLEVGSIHELPKVIGDQFVVEGKLKAVVEEVKTTDKVEDLGKDL